MDQDAVSTQILSGSVEYLQGSHSIHVMDLNSEYRNYMSQMPFKDFAAELNISRHLSISKKRKGRIG